MVVRRNKGLAQDETHEMSTHGDMDVDMDMDMEPPTGICLLSH